MRAKQAVLRRMCGVALALAPIVASCTHAAMVGSQPNTRRLVLNGQEVEVETGIDDAKRVADELGASGMSVSTLWRVPGDLTMRLAIVEKPAAEAGYGPQLVALRVGDDVRVLHESPRLYDDDFVYPTFFAFSDRTLMLADHGSEDAYGVLAWSIEKGGVRDLGQLNRATRREGRVHARCGGNSTRSNKGRQIRDHHPPDRCS